MRLRVIKIKKLLPRRSTKVKHNNSTVLPFFENLRPKLSLYLKHFNGTDVFKSTKALSHFL